MLLGSNAAGDVDLDLPSAARIYDFYLGGFQHFAIDREFGKKALQIYPDAAKVALENRKFLGRAVGEALNAGITQFIDIGAGLPTRSSTHQVVQRVMGDATEGAVRVVYVDNEPLARAHAVDILRKERITAWCGAALEDARAPHAVLNHPVVREMINFERPVCLLMIALWHFVEDGIPTKLAAYRSRLAPGSWCAISHVGPDDADSETRERIEKAREAYRSTQNPLYVRDREEIVSWFDGMDIVTPGVTHLHQWRPDEWGSDPELDAMANAECERIGRAAWCGVGQVR